MATKTAEKSNVPTAVDETKKNQIIVADDITDQMLDDDAGFGNEMSVADVALPYLYILQKNSPVCEEGHTAYVDGAKPGMIYNNVSNEVYVAKEGGILFVPCYYERKYVEWVDRDKGGGWVAEYDVDSDILSHTVKNDRGKPVMKGTGNIIMETAYHFGLFSVDGDEWSQSSFPLKSTGLKYNKKWNNELTTARNPRNPALKAPRWLFPYRITTFLESKNNNTWYSPRIERLDRTVSGSVYAEAKKFNEMAREGILKRGAETGAGDSQGDSNSSGGGESADDIPF